MQIPITVYFQFLDHYEIGGRNFEMPIIWLSLTPEILSGLLLVRDTTPITSAKI